MCVNNLGGMAASRDIMCRCNTYMFIFLYIYIYIYIYMHDDI